MLCATAALDWEFSYRHTEQRALRVITITFFALALYRIVDGIVSLVTASRADTGPAGIAISAAVLVVMPVLARAKGAVGRRIDGPRGALVLAEVLALTG